MALKEVVNIDNNQNNLEKFSNIEAELALIGCLLWDNRNYEKIADFLSEDHFIDKNNQLIYKTIKGLLDKNVLVSPITLKNYLSNEDNNLDNIKYLNQIKDSAPSTHNAYQYAKIIYDLHIKRSLIGIGRNIVQETVENNDDLEGQDLIDNAENDLYLLSQTGNTDRKHSYFSDALKNAVEVIDEAFKRDGKIAGLPTGLRDLDKKLGGLHNSDLIIIAGRPSMGKSALAINFVEHAIMSDRSALVFSLEMPSEQIVMRLLSSLGRIDQNRLRTGELLDEDWTRFTGAVSQLRDKKLYIDDNYEYM